MVNKHVRQALVLATCLLLLGWLPPTASADEDSGFRLWVEPIDLWVLEKDQDTNSSKFQEYRDLRSGLWAGLKLYGESADGGDRNLAVRLQGIGREDARYMLDYRREGKYSFSLDYNKIPHRFGNDAVMAWDRPVPNRLEFPDSVQGLNPADILVFVNSADRVDLGLGRDRTNARFDVGKLGKLAWAFEYTHENRTGDRPFGGAFGFGNVLEIAEPIDYDTTGAEISGELNGKKGGLRFGYRYSEFENQFDAVVWDNIFNAVEANLNPARGRADLAPDNEANLFFLDGRAKGESWWFNGNVVYNVLTQDDRLLPYTINTGIEGNDPFTGATFPAASAGLPVTSADREAEILTFSANAGTDLGEDWSLTLRYRYYDYDNTSPRIRFPGYVRMDERWTSDPLITVPYSYTRENVGIELGWDVTRTTNLALAYTMESWDREFREVSDADEDIVKLSLNSRPSKKVTVRASWATGDRSIGDYLTEAQLAFFVEEQAINNLPTLRKFDQAERNVDDYEVAVQLFPDDKWNFSFGLSGREEDYDKSEFGLVSDEVLNYNFELGYTPGANLNVYLFGHNEDREVFQRGRQSGGQISTNPADTWTVLLNEDTMTWGLGVNGKGDKGWTWDLSVHLSDTDGEGDFETPPGGSPSAAVDIGNYEDIELLSAWLKVGYEINDKVSCGAFYLYEDYTIDSFILQGLRPFLAGTLLLVPNDGDYQANLFGVSLKFVF